MTAEPLLLGLDLGRSALHAVLVDGEGRLHSARVHFLDQDVAPLPEAVLAELLAAAGSPRVARVAVATSRFDEPAWLAPVRVLRVRIGAVPALAPSLPGLVCHDLRLDPAMDGAVARAQLRARLRDVDAVVLAPADHEAALALFGELTRDLEGVPLPVLRSPVTAPVDAVELRQLLRAARIAPEAWRLVDQVESVLGRLLPGVPLGFVGGDGGLHAAAAVRAQPLRLVYGASAAAQLAAGTAGRPHQLLLDGGAGGLRILFREDGAPRMRPGGPLWGGAPLGLSGFDLVSVALGGDLRVVRRRGRLQLMGPPTVPAIRGGAPSRKRASLTPSDAARLMGRTTLGAEPSARAVAALRVRQWEAAGAPVELLARRVLDHVEGELAAAVVAAALARSGDDPRWFERARHQPVLAAALTPAGGPPGGALLAVGVRLMRPLVGCGGFLPCILERPAIRLDTSRLLPARPELLAALGTLLAEPISRLWAPVPAPDRRAALARALAEVARAWLMAAGGCRGRVRLYEAEEEGRPVLVAEGCAGITPRVSVRPDWR